MYDQVRLDWVKVKITPTMSVLLQNQKQAIFVSAWDRNGLSNRNEPPNFTEICSYSSAFQRAINMDATTWSATRKIYATSLAEKSFFIPTSFIQSPTSASLTSTGFNVPPGQSLSFPWNPQLLIGVLLSSATVRSGVPQLDIPANSQTWNFFLEFEWGLTFRGLRFDVPTGGAPMVKATTVSNPRAQVQMSTEDPDPQDEVQPRFSTSVYPNFVPDPGTFYLLSLFVTKSKTTRIPFPYGYVVKSEKHNASGNNIVKFYNSSTAGRCFGYMFLAPFENKTRLQIGYLSPTSIAEVYVDNNALFYPLFSCDSSLLQNAFNVVLNYQVGVSEKAQITLTTTVTSASKILTLPGNFATLMAFSESNAYKLINVVNAVQAGGPIGPTVEPQDVDWTDRQLISV